MLDLVVVILFFVFLLNESALCYVYEKVVLNGGVLDKLIAFFHVPLMVFAYRNHYEYTGI